MAPESSSSSSGSRSGPMNPLTATATVAKAIMSAPTGNGRLVATILSAYDLPSDDVPSSVLMSYSEGNGRGGTNEISTGPPAAKHRDHANSFKFGGANGGSLTSSNSGATAANRLILSAPLSTLFESTVTFTVTYADPARNLTSKCTISKTLRVNDTQWLILNLDSENQAAAGGHRSSPIKSSASRISSSGSNVGDQPPTLRLKLRLEGPYRPEISAVINLANSWFAAVDVVSDATVGTATGLARDLPKNFPAAKLLLVPVVPLATLGVAALPIVGGILIIGIPFFLPIILIVLTVALGLGAIGTTVYFSTRDGRTSIQHVAEPTYQTFLMTNTGQRIVYDVGPRPSPQALARAVLPTDMMGKLVASLLVDLVGSASYLIPLAGEAFDLTWAPISMILVGALYDDVMPNLKYVALMEELLPFTDWIPSATLGWVKEFGPGIFDEGKRKMGDAQRVGRREREALVSMTR
eukprot:CAMPEP_0172532246 /NCGR_PEP_ID=MMETSP1067-20121228/5370_1 /TAXON_ID=265564 ORGANISM="Thalassiosira punctigera, Strain Tpunct2005C2" /NCGR_SAMPLE_ID=MMETSP1067 /ASSEMBLY_ACC=CAM_ASM_000444 /LENGTH=467 /DNA_ID=CAMNT_0013316743 /DNA_START=186 /DNA_END=1589 /DNA_ORIENTATION=+